MCMHAATAPKGETLSELILLLFLALSLPSLESPEIGHSHRKKKKKKHPSENSNAQSENTAKRALHTNALHDSPMLSRIGIGHG